MEDIDRPTRRKRAAGDDDDDDDNGDGEVPNHKVARRDTRASDEDEEDEQDAIDAGKLDANEPYEEEFDEAEAEQLGDRVEPFNLNEERDMGRFEASGNFVWTRKGLGEDGEEKDAWLDETLKDEEKKLKEQQQQSAAGEDRNNHSVPVIAKSSIPPTRQDANQVLCTIVSLLKKGENVLDAIRRPGQTHLEHLTKGADDLLGMGLTTIYSDTREQLASRLPRIVWQYRNLNDRSKIYGPFPASSMQCWREEGFFTATSYDKVETRAASSAELFHEFEWKKAETVRCFFFDEEQEDRDL